VGNVIDTDCFSWLLKKLDQQRSQKTLILLLRGECTTYVCSYRIASFEKFADEKKQ